MFCYSKIFFYLVILEIFNSAANEVNLIPSVNKNKIENSLHDFQKKGREGYHNQSIIAGDAKVKETLGHIFKPRTKNKVHANLLGVQRPSIDSSPEILETQSEYANHNWPMGIVPYTIDPNHYDNNMIVRIVNVMVHIKSKSCILFKEFTPPSYPKGSYLFITNPDNVGECVHKTPQSSSEIKVVIGYNCVGFGEILHTLLHGIGFHDEVTHPQRDQYISVLWHNIQPKYRSLFAISHTDPTVPWAEYDPSSIMHFHERAFSANGGATIAALVPGLRFKLRRHLSQLDVMRLRLAFGNACKQRQVGALIHTCEKRYLKGESYEDANMTSCSCEFDWFSSSER